MYKESNVAVIYQGGRLSRLSYEQGIKLEKRLQRAIEDLAEDGFKRFFIPILDYNTSFPYAFASAFSAAKEAGHNIELRMVLLYKIDRRDILSPYEKHEDLLSYADLVTCNQEEYFEGRPTNIIENILECSSALISYYENYSPELHYVTHYAQLNRLQFINISTPRGISDEEFLSKLPSRTPSLSPSPSPSRTSSPSSSCTPSPSSSRMRGSI